MSTIKADSPVRLVDARGLSCPEPVLRTRQVIRELRSGTVEVLVDSGTSRDNVTRAAEKAGWRVTVRAEPAGGYRLVLERGPGSPR